MLNIATRIANNLFSLAIVLFVDGSQRIAFFASHDIPEQSELLFNYMYNTHLDNEFLLQTPAENVKWMKKTPAEEKPTIDADNGKATGAKKRMKRRTFRRNTAKAK
jgi:hypothetical protein